MDRRTSLPDGRYVRARWAIRFLAIVLLPASLASLGPAYASSASYRRGALTLLTTDGGRVNWSADGTTLYFDRADAESIYEVWRMNPDGSGQQCVTCAHPQLPAGRHRGNPEIDPTGRYLVFQVEKATHSAIAAGYTAPGLGVYNDLWVLDLVTDTATQLTDGSSTCVSLVLHPQFSPDGTELLWMHAPGGGLCLALDDAALAVADFVPSPAPHLGSIQSYTPAPPPDILYESHGWGPDGSWVYFTCLPVAGMSYSNMDICRMDLASPGQVTRLTSSSGLNGEPAEWDEHAHLSPFRDAFVWMSTQDTGWDGSIANLRTDYWLMNADGSAPRRLTFFNDPLHDDYFGSGAVASDVDWDPTGRALVMYVQPGRIYRLDFEPIPIAGQRLAITDPGDPTRRAITFAAKDAAIDTSAGVGVDPVSDGAWVQVYSASGTGDAVCFALDGGGEAGWTAKGDPARQRFSYRDRDGVNGPCRIARIGNHGSLKVSCRARVQPIDYSLDEPIQQSVAVRFGSGATEYCTVFGGSIVRDTQGRFTARKAPAPVECPPPPTNCGP